MFTLNCKLDMLHPLQGERNTVQFSWSRDVTDDLLVVNVEVPLVNNSGRFQVNLPNVPLFPHPPRTLNLKLFSLAYHEKLLTELCMASTFIPTAALLQRSVLEFMDTDDSPQAQLIIEWANLDPRWLQNIPREYHDPGDQKYTQDLIAACRDKYKRKEFSFNDRQVFYSLSTENGFVPTVCFPILATLRPRKISERQTAFLLRLLVVALSLRGLSAPLDQLSPVELLELISEMLTMVTKCLVYTPDRTRSANAEQTFNEQWERPSLFPHRALAGYDCEDCSVWAQEIGYALRDPQHASSLPSALAPVSKILRRMTMFTCKGDLRAGQWTAHCYSLLLDSEYVDYLLGSTPRRRTSYIPSVVIEGTSWIEGVWQNRPAGAPPPRMRAIEDLGGKVYTPEDPSPYGPVAQIDTADHRGTALTLALVRDHVMGVRLTELVHHQAEPSDVQVWTSTPPSMRSSLISELIELPLTNIPGYGGDPTITPTTGKRGRAVMRWVDWTESLGKAERVQLSDDGLAFAYIS